ncbi:MAG: aldo/keto reductase [Dysgonamonadaceae bacterium]|jgi:L-glyceraldehyde 3-phosphate reductase|nr:aldo/keto reductase [Dysgonamonadaceae bacterium]
MDYRFCGNSGLQLPLVSLGLWHNFGDTDNFSIAKDIIIHAFEQGITHFDLANNYGSPPGSAESNFGKVLKTYLKNHRDEMIVSSKAGHLMWNGPYGDGGSRKYLMASIDQSLKRTGLDYFDIFYSHRYCPETPLEETIQTLIDIVKQGKALYASLSKYPAGKAFEACEMMKAQNVRCLIYQDKYNLLHRQPEREHFSLFREQGLGFIAFSPLAQGLLTNRYINGIPDDSRAAKPHGFLQKEDIKPELTEKIKQLNRLAERRGQSLAQMSLAWLLAKKEISSVIVGASSVKQLQDNILSINNIAFSSEELNRIEQVFPSDSK